MKLDCFKLRLVIEIDPKTTIVITHQQAITVKAPGANRGTMLFISRELASAGVTVKGPSFRFPATADFQVILIYDPECHLATARVIHSIETDALTSDETDALIARRTEEADSPKVDIQAVIGAIDDLESVVYFPEEGEIEKEVDNDT